MRAHFLLLLPFLLFELGSSMSSSLGISCRDHPAYFEGMKGVLIKSWEVSNGIESFPGMYIVGHDTHRYAPIQDPGSKKFAGLDWFWLVKVGNAIENYVKLSLSRRAKVYILVPFRTSSNPSLRGWISEGIVKLVKGEGIPLPHGIYQREEGRHIASTMYVFSKQVNGVAWLPNMKWIEENVRGLAAAGDWVVMVAEADGTAPVYPRNPAGVRQAIIPNQRCPDQLHDLWVTRNTDESDPDTRGMKWKTWHPQWDSCYWCAYDHEHGSSPKHLMGYEPKFHYTAWKNGRENESHQGFKGYVFRYQSYFVYFMVHMQSSNLRRVVVPHHTLLFAVTDANTKELLMEVTHKADFGFIAVKSKANLLIPLTPGERAKHDKQMAEGALRNFRSINVLDMADLKPNYLYRTPYTDILKGIYETWTTVPLCSADNRLGLVSFDITNAATGIKYPVTENMKVMKLGYYKDGKLFRQVGNSRLLRVSNFNTGDKYCRFGLPSGSGRRYPDGSFYTDPYGTHLRGGAGPGSVRQFVKPGFNLRMSGEFAPGESWTGLYVPSTFGVIENYGYTIDPEIN